MNDSLLETAEPEPVAGSTGLLVFTIVVAAGLGFLALLMHAATWTSQQFAIASGWSFSPFAWPLVVGLHGLLVAGPAYVLSRSRWPLRYKAVFQTWALSGLFVFFTVPQHLVGPTAALTAAILQIAGAALFIIVLALWSRRANDATRFWPPYSGPYWPVLLVVPLIVWPWFIWGSLGSGWDTALNIVVGMMLGLATALIAHHHLLPALQTDAPSDRSAIVLGGLALGGSLTTMGAAYGVNGQQLILLFLLPSLAWLAMALGSLVTTRSWPHSWLILASIIGLVAAAPLVFVDPDELLLVLNAGTRDIGAWTTRATAASTALALAIGTVAILLVRRREGAGHQTAGRLAAGVGWAGLLALFLVNGQPGWHGDRLFVVMDAPAPLPERGGQDYWTYRAEVYDSLTGQATASQSELRSILDWLGITYTPYYLVNALEVDGGPLLRLWLEQRTDVDRVLDSPELRPLPQPAPLNTGALSAPTSPAWNLTSIQAPDVWEELSVTGTGIVIGQSDSGAEVAHPELTAQYRGNRTGSAPGDTYNWLDPWNNSQSPTDTGGHGTHTLGSIVGERVGVAPGASWIACVNLDRNLANPARYLDCLQFLFAPFPPDGDPFVDGRSELGAHILNNSWSCPTLEGCDPDSLLPAVEALRQAGVFFVASAGNSGNACNTVDAPPAHYDATFAVAAVDQFGALAPFSSRGPVTIDGSGRLKPDIAAPGVDVLSAFPGGTYSELSGTSMAGPHVAGVVALIWSANPALIGDIDRTEQILIETAQPYDLAEHGVPECGSATERPDNATGYGLVDALAAVRLALDLAPASD